MTTMELIERGIGHNCLSDAYDLGREDGRKEAVQLIRKLIKIFWKDWNKSSHKHLPYLALDELDEHILEQADESNGREFMEYYKQIKESKE